MAASSRSEQQVLSSPNKSNKSKQQTNRNNNKRKKQQYNTKKKRRKQRYKRKTPLTPTELSLRQSSKLRRTQYENMRSQSLEKNQEPPSIWSFDSLFPEPILDTYCINEDLYGDKVRESKVKERHEKKQLEAEMLKRRKLDLDKSERDYLISVDKQSEIGTNVEAAAAAEGTGREITKEQDIELTRQTIMNTTSSSASSTLNSDTTTTTTNTRELELNISMTPLSSSSKQQQKQQPVAPVDRTLTRLVEDRLSGFTRTPSGSIQYSTSLLDSSRAVQFREGIRLGKALNINIDRLCHFAKKDVSHGRLEEAQEYYIKAQIMDPTDGRPYLGLSRIATRRGDLQHARGLLKEGIRKSSGGFVNVKGPSSVSVVQKKNRKNNNRNSGTGGNKRNKSDVDFQEEEGKTIGTIPDVGANPFLLQALGQLEEKMGNLYAAEELYLQALRSRPSHAASWVALAQLRTKKLRQGASAGRACYQSAERELLRIGAKPNPFVYTAWASMEYKKGSREDDIKCLRRARELYEKALSADPHCSVAYLQLGVMESECGNFDEAKQCFEKVLTFDQRNSRVLQAYAIMESRRLPKEDVDSRRVLDLFERALKANPRDAGVYQAYALYVVELGDIDSARDLLRRGTEVNKRHPPVWQAWGVLETRFSTAKNARDVFQQGIWACAQPGGGQSGGRRCARLWQAWGVLEAQEGDHAAARRCFNRALDADQRNVAAVTAWTLMEAELGNFADARSIFERSLKLFRSPSADKTSIWRAYEVMEERAGNTREAQMVFQRSMGETMAKSTIDEEVIIARATNPSSVDGAQDMIDAAAFDSSRPKSSKRSQEIEVSRWDTESGEMDAEVWMNNGSIEGKVPASMMKRLKTRSSNETR